MAFIAILTAVAGLAAISTVDKKPSWFTQRASAPRCPGPLFRRHAQALAVRHCDGGPPDAIAMKTLYDLLGARPGDDAVELKNAFRKAVKANHPDLHPDDPDAAWRLSGIVRAYMILRDPQERAAYDGALEYERELLRHKSKRSVVGILNNVISEAVAVAVLAVALGGGYVLLANFLGSNGVKVAGGTAREPIKIASVEHAAPTRMTDREKPHDPAGVVVPSIAMISSVAATAAKRSEAPEKAEDVAAPNLSEQEGARETEDSGVRADRGDSRAIIDQFVRGPEVEPPNKEQLLSPAPNAAPSAPIELSSLENDKNLSKSSSPDFAIFDRKKRVPDAKLLDPKTLKVRGHEKSRVAAIRPSPDRAPLKQASLENKTMSACYESQSCAGKSSPLLGVGF